MAGRRVRLARARKAATLTQEDLAHLVGVDRSTVGRWEAGETDPQPWVRRKLAKHLGVTAQQLDALLADDLPGPPPKPLTTPKPTRSNSPAARRRPTWAKRP